MAAALRRTLVTTALVAAAGALAWAGPPLAVVRGTGPASADTLLARIATLTAWAVLSWLVVAALVTTVASLPGTSGRIAGALARRIAPATVRRALEAALGVALTVSATSPAAALATVRDRPAVAAERAVGDRVSFGQVDLAARQVEVPQVDFDRPHSSRVSAPRVALTPLAVVTGAARETHATDADRSIVVRRGDSLWSIARRSLEASASHEEIDVHWRRWYAANKAAIGPDPHLIRPGLVLLPPGSPAAPTP